MELENKNGIYEPKYAGGVFWSCAQEAIRIAQRYGCIQIKFNGIQMRINPDSNLDDLSEIYGLKCTIRRNHIEEEA